VKVLVHGCVSTQGVEVGTAACVVTTEYPVPTTTVLTAEVSVSVQVLVSTSVLYAVTAVVKAEEPVILDVSVLTAVYGIVETMVVVL